MLHTGGDLEECLLARVHLGCRDSLRLLLGLFRGTPQHLRVVSEFLLLHEKTEHEPEKREWRKGTLEEIADDVECEILVGVGLYGADDEIQSANDPRERHDKPEPDTPVPTCDEPDQGVAGFHYSPSLSVSLSKNPRPA